MRLIKYNGSFLPQNYYESQVGRLTQIDDEKEKLEQESTQTSDGKKESEMQNQVNVFVQQVVFNINPLPAQQELVQPREWQSLMNDIGWFPKFAFEQVSRTLDLPDAEKKIKVIASRKRRNVPVHFVLLNWGELLSKTQQCASALLTLKTQVRKVNAEWMDCSHKKSEAHFNIKNTPQCIKGKLSFMVPGQEQPGKKKKTEFKEGRFVLILDGTDSNNQIRTLISLASHPLKLCSENAADLKQSRIKRIRKTSVIT